MMLPEPPLLISVMDLASASGAAASPSTPQLLSSDHPVSVPLILKPLEAIPPKPMTHLVAGEAEELLGLSVSPAAEVSDYVYHRIGPFGLGHGHRHGYAFGIICPEGAAYRGADKEVHLRGGAGGKPEASVLDREGERGVQGFKGHLGGGSGKSGNHREGVPVVCCLDGVVDLGLDSEVCSIPGEGHDRTHVLGGHGDLRNRLAVKLDAAQHGRHDILGSVGLDHLQFLAGAEQAGCGCQCGYVSKNFHFSFVLDYFTVA